MTKIKSLATPEQINKLSNTKTVSEKFIETLHEKALNGAYIKLFFKDLEEFGLWEALLNIQVNEYKGFKPRTSIILLNIALS